MKKSVRNTLLIGSIIALAAIVFIFAAKQTMFELNLPFEKNVTIAGYSATVKSTNDFGDITRLTCRTSPDGLCVNPKPNELSPDDEHYYIFKEKNLVTDFGINLEYISQRNEPDFMSGIGQMRDFRTYVYTTSMNLTSDNLIRVSFDWSNKNSFSCGSNSGAEHGASAIYLVSRNHEILLASGQGLRNKVGCKKTCDQGFDNAVRSGTVIIEKVGNDVFLDANGQRTKLELKNDESYNIGIFGNGGGGSSCYDYGGSIAEDTQITNLKVDKIVETVSSGTQTGSETNTNPTGQTQQDANEESKSFVIIIGIIIAVLVIFGIALAVRANRK